MVGFNFWIWQEKGVIAYMNSQCNVLLILEDLPIIPETWHGLTNVSEKVHLAQLMSLSG